MFSFHSKYFVYREVKRAPQKLSFCLRGWILVPSGYWATYGNERSLTLHMTAKQIPNVLATFATTLVATFLLYGEQNVHSLERFSLVMFTASF